LVQRRLVTQSAPEAIGDERRRTQATG